MMRAAYALPCPPCGDGIPPPKRARPPVCCSAGKWTSDWQKVPKFRPQVFLAILAITALAAIPFVPGVATDNSIIERGHAAAISALAVIAGSLIKED